MALPQLTLSAARHLHLADILTTIQRMSLLQIDTINIVARSPYLVLFSRLGHYPPEWLDSALRQGELMEYWAHEACFLPRSDFALVRHRMLSPDNMGWKYRQAWMQEHAEEIEQLIAHIHEKGPVRSADFEHPHKGTSGWWEWKPHKRHLEGLFTAGKVMVIERRNFQRVYDLTHRVMPEWDDSRDMLTQAAAEAVMLENSARSLGIFRGQWLADYYRLRQPALGPLLEGWQAKSRCLRRRRRANSPPLTALSCRRLIRWSGIVSVRSNCLTSATGWSAIPRHRNVSTAISFCRCCIKGNWWGEWTQKCTVKPVSCRLSPSGWKRVCGSALGWKRG